MALILALTGAAPAGANPAAIAQALDLCRAVVKAESWEPLAEAGLEELRVHQPGQPLWHRDYAAPAAIGELQAGRGEVVIKGETVVETNCTLHLPAPTNSAATRWEKLALGSVMALEGKGYEMHGGSPANPALRRCPQSGKPTFVRLHHDKDLGAVRLSVTDTGPAGQTCKE